MTTLFKTLLASACLMVAAQASAQITFYEHDGFQGRTFSTERNVMNFDRFGFNDRASSVVVQSRERWEVCEAARFEGRCVVLRPGSYSSLSAMGLNDRVSSVRMVNRNTDYADDRYAPPPVNPYYDSRRRNNERLFEAPVTSVRAVVGPAERRCWIERENVGGTRGDANVPGAVLGAVIGGILGHQVGGGTGRDIATAGGVVAGAAIGANTNRGSSGGRMQDVQRCDTVANTGPPHHWDVTYDFRGTTHRVQMTTQPGATITVNRQGEPRA